MSILFSKWNKTEEEIVNEEFKGDWNAYKTNQQNINSMPREVKQLPDLIDGDIIPIGKYKKGGSEGGANGTRMIDVPAKYLLFIYNNNMCDARTAKYILNNMNVLKEQAKNE